MVPLGRGAVVTLDGFLRGFAFDGRRLVAGVAHAGCGPLGQDGVQARAQLGVQPALDRRHAVFALPADGDAALAGPVLIGVVAVGVEHSGVPVGEPLELIGAIGRGHLGQLGFGLSTG